MAYKMTARRARALRKAQEVSARKRKKRFGFASGKKLSQGHKRAIGVVAAGAVIGSGAFGALYLSNKRAKQKQIIAKKPGDDLKEISRPQRPPGKANNRWFNKPGGGAAKTRVVRPVGDVEIYVNSTNETVRRIMSEIHGKKVKRRQTGKFKVIFGERPMPETKDN